MHWKIWEMEMNLVAQDLIRITLLPPVIPHISPLRAQNTGLWQIMVLIWVSKEVETYNLAGPTAVSVCMDLPHNCLL
jgi:hypothetical protein